MASSKKAVDKLEDAAEAVVEAAEEVVEAAKAEPKKAAQAPTGAGRPNDNPIGKYKVPNSTFAERAKAQGKRVAGATNKAIKADDTEAK